MNKSNRYAPEGRERADRLVFEHEKECPLAVVSDVFYCVEERVYAGDASPLGAPG